MMDRLKKKYNTARKYVPRPVVHTMDGATVGIIAFGSTESAVLEAQHQLATEHGLKADFMRVRAIPFTDEVTAFVKKYDQIFIVEMNRDGQMGQLLMVEYPEHAANFRTVAFGDGLPASAKWVREGILSYASESAKVVKTKTAQTKKIVSKKAVVSKTKKATKKSTSKPKRK